MESAAVKGSQRIEENFKEIVEKLYTALKGELDSLNSLVIHITKPSFSQAFT